MFPLFEGPGGAALMDQGGEDFAGQANAFEGQPVEGVNGVRQLTSRTEIKEGTDEAGRARVVGGSFSWIWTGWEVIERLGRREGGHWGEKP